MEILLVCALYSEIRPLLQMLRKRGAQVSGYGLSRKFAFGCKRITACSLGLGAQRSSKNFQKILRQEKPQMVLLAGCSGAIHPHQKTGDVLVVDNIRDVTRKFINCASLMGPSEKKKMGERFPEAFGVDLESSGLAMICSEHSIPLVCVRVIFDEMDDPLPSLRRAWELPLWYMCYRSASRSLSQAVERVLEKVCHCEEALADEAIRRSTGLLRFARNDKPSC